MKTKVEYTLMIGLLLACIFVPVGWALAIDWIQSTERVVGEGHATYPDVVNRPTKQMWGNFTSQHTATGAHKPEFFPTPLPTPTPIPENALIDWTDATTDFSTAGVVYANAQPIYLYVIWNETEPNIPEDTACFWVIESTGQYFWLLDSGGVQKYVELDIIGRDDSGPGGEG